LRGNTLQLQSRPTAQSLGAASTCRGPTGPLGDVEKSMSKGILYDATLCIGCKQCEQACATENGLPYDDRIADQQITSAHKYTAILIKDDKFMRKLCMNCDDPACASVCPVGALKKNRSRTRHVRQEPLHGMPILHGGLPLRRA
jgi:ferredoxin